jgi:hypothetical protein
MRPKIPGSARASKSISHLLWKMVENMSKISAESISMSILIMFYLMFSKDMKKKDSVDNMNA